MTRKATKEDIIRELAIRELESRTELQKSSLIEYQKYIFLKEKKKEFKYNWVHLLIAEKLEKVLKGEIKRLIINIPPRFGKTELVTKAFPTWGIGNRQDLSIIATGYSTNLTQTFSGEARDYYQSSTYKEIFPRSAPIRDDQNTKEWWTNTAGGSYYATGTGGSITGRGANIFIIDDPLKPDEAESDIKRVGINNWYDNTVLSRLNNQNTDAIVIIMQRTHENDLCGHLIEKMNNGTGEKFEVLSIPAIAEKDEEHRKEGESIQEERMPISFLNAFQKQNPVVFSCQYQQNPIARESQEFFVEWFKYYKDIPQGGRVFTCVDPAFSKKTTADYTSVITGKFVDDNLYILEVTNAKLNPAELEDMIIYHIKKWNPEKVGVEAFQAQRMIGFSLRNRLQKENIYVSVEDITQSGDKNSKIRRLVPLYRNGQIYHNTSEGCQLIESQLLKFPRGTHDDAIDSLQMLFDLYKLNAITQQYADIHIKYDINGLPVSVF